MMRKPRRRAPLASGENDGVRVELHKQTIGYVIWSSNSMDPDAAVWLWAAFETREQATEDALREYGVKL